MFLKLREIQAFTLAEVLITLGIIGVVAAMTIPTLVANYQKHQTVVGLQKALSEFSQAFKYVEQQNGPMTEWDSPSTEWDSTQSAAWWNKNFLPYQNLSVIRTCDIGSDQSKCLAPNYYLDGTPTGIGANSVTFVLKDGSSVNFAGVGNSMALMYVDISGLKKPNVVGKDIFALEVYYKAGKVLPFGAGISRVYLMSDNSHCCNKTKNNLYKGNYCGALIQQDGWQIKDDYPWN